MGLWAIVLIVFAVLLIIGIIRIILKPADNLGSFIEYLKLKKAERKSKKE
jgi:uncharacterized protein YxeA